MCVCLDFKETKKTSVEEENLELKERIKLLEAQISSRNVPSNAGIMQSNKLLTIFVLKLVADWFQNPQDSVA